MEVNVTLSTTKEYADELKRRMDKDGISQNELAAAMGKSPTQVSRWFTKNPKRRVNPSLDMVRDIEATMKRLLHNRERRERRAEAKHGEGSDMNE
jgi:Helix-turn-helix.